MFPDVLLYVIPNQVIVDSEYSNVTRPSLFYAILIPLWENKYCAAVKVDLIHGNKTTNKTFSAMHTT